MNLARRNRLVLPVVLVFALLGVASCSADSPVSSPSAPYVAPAPAPAPANVAPAPVAGTSSVAVSYGQQWTADNCLANVVYSGTRTLSVTESNLCRATTNVDGFTFYNVFPRGNPGAAVGVYGTESDGYLYWHYPNLAWFREAISGSQPAQIKVSYTNGSTAYVDEATWASTPANSAFLYMIRVNLAEEAALNLQEQTYSATVTSTGLSTDQTAAAQQQQAAKDKQAKAEQQQAASQAAAAPKDSPALDQEYQFLTQINGEYDRVWTQPTCETYGYYCP